MTFAEAMAALEAAGSEQTRKTYRRHGVPDPMFGVSVAALTSMKKAIKAGGPADDAQAAALAGALADALWATGNHDARVLACLIGAPARAAAWAPDVATHVLGHYVAALAARGPEAEAARLAAAWIAHPDEQRQRLGWDLIAMRALQPKAALDAEGLLVRIEASIGAAPNRAKQGMHGALLAIGCRSAAHAEAAIAAAERIGTVVIDHGDTACTTPEAVAYIRKARARAEAKAAKSSP